MGVTSHLTYEAHFSGDMYVSREDVSFVVTEGEA